jgi:hypothetical protein
MTVQQVKILKNLQQTLAPNAEVSDLFNREF